MNSETKRVASVRVDLGLALVDVELFRNDAPPFPDQPYWAKATVVQGQGEGKPQVEEMPTTSGAALDPVKSISMKGKKGKGRPGRPRRDLGLPNQCPYCPRTCANQASMRRHLAIHTGQFQCPSCPAQYGNQTSVTKHLREAHGVEVKRPQDKASLARRKAEKAQKDAEKGKGRKSKAKAKAPKKRGPVPSPVSPPNSSGTSSSPEFSPLPNPLLMDANAAVPGPGRAFYPSTSTSESMDAGPAPMDAFSGSEFFLLTPQPEFNGPVDALPIGDLSLLCPEGQDDGSLFADLFKISFPEPESQSEQQGQDQGLKIPEEDITFRLSLVDDGGTEFMEL